MKIFKNYIFLLIFICFLSEASAAESPYRPLGMEIVNPVQRWEDSPDAYAVEIQNYFLPYFDNDFAGERLDMNQLLSSGAVDITNTIGEYSIQPTEPSSLRVYFISESTSKQNSLGFLDASTINNPGTNEGLLDTAYEAGNENLIFPDATHKTWGWGWGGRHDTLGPLQPLDYVDIGTFTAGSEVNFFVIENSDSSKLNSNSGNNYDDDGGKNSFKNLQLWNTQSLFDVTTKNTSSDDYYHFKYYSLPGRDEILVAFDNTVDNDFNDLFFLVQVIAVPEPAIYFLIGMILTVMQSMVILNKKSLKHLPNSSHITK